MNFLNLMTLAPLSGMRGDHKLIHAVTVDSIAAVLGNRKRTVKAPCGEMVKITSINGRVGLWPPRVQGIPGAIPRCKKCYELTGKPRFRAIPGVSGD